MRGAEVSGWTRCSFSLQTWREQEDVKCPDSLNLETGYLELNPRSVSIAKRSQT